MKFFDEYSKKTKKNNLEVFEAINCYSFCIIHLYEIYINYSF